MSGRVVVRVKTRSYVADGSFAADTSARRGRHGADFAGVMNKRREESGAACQRLRINYARNGIYGENRARV